MYTYAVKPLAGQYFAISNKAFQLRTGPLLYHPTFEIFYPVLGSHASDQAFLQWTADRGRFSRMVLVLMRKRQARLKGVFSCMVFVGTGTHCIWITFQKLFANYFRNTSCANGTQYRTDSCSNFWEVQSWSLDMSHKPFSRPQPQYWNNFSGPMGASTFPDSPNLLLDHIWWPSNITSLCICAWRYCESRSGLCARGDLVEM